MAGRTLETRLRSSVMAARGVTHGSGATAPATTSGSAEDAFSRRREVAATSARSLLLTVLGEFVLPRGEPVWTQALLDALGSVGVEEKSARQALARTAADDVVVSERAGRRVRWSLTASGERLLSEGAERIYAHGAHRPPWDGRWLVLVVSVPEKSFRSSGVGEVAVSVVDPQDKPVAGRVAASSAGKGRWQATIRFGKAMPLEDLAWSRVKLESGGEPRLLHTIRGAGYVLRA